MTIEIETRDLAAMIARVHKMGDHVDEACVLAVNDAARFGRSAGKKQILEEINYKKSYLGSERDGRLAVTKYARRGESDPIAEVTGRDRPTSLAQFVKGAKRFGRQAGVKVKVGTKSAAQTLKGAFLIKLKRGSAAFDGENYNEGLAVRVKKGESLRNSSAAKDIGGGVYLLYGPSVDQAFQGVAADVVNDVSDKLESEFIRQYERLDSNGR